jgi:hypothetical protein
MSGFFQDLLRGAAGGFFGSDYLRDFTHASKTFRPNFYENTPKYKFLFHTYFEINQEIYNAGIDDKQNLGLLVKEIKLPSYTFDTFQLNQYNRKRIIQTKIKYEPITITFHDDNANKATKLWEAYYRYNYRDMDKSLNRGIDNGRNILTDDVPYETRNIYQPSIIGENWGFTGDAYNNNNVKVQFFKNITVYGLNRHNFVSYTLVNPVITQFSHDTYNYDQGSGIMQNQMTIDYETVVYDYGSIDGTRPDNIVTGFGREETYDRRLSPISIPGSNRTILGQGGLVDGVGGTIEALSQGNILGAIKLAGTTYNTFKDTDLKQNAKQELLNGVTSALTNPNVTRNVGAFFQQVGSTPSTVGTAGTPTTTDGPYSATTYAAVDTRAGITREPLPAGGQVRVFPVESSPPLIRTQLPNSN